MIINEDDDHDDDNDDINNGNYVHNDIYDGNDNL